MIPEPLKRPFGWPLPAAALDYFCHPTLPAVMTPLRHPEDGMVYCVSPFGALRIRRFHGHAEEFPTMGEEMVARLAALPWATLREQGQTKDLWRLMDDARGTLWRDPPLPLYRLKDFNWQATREKRVRICGGPIVPLALLQVLSRLPRMEICVADSSPQQPVFFRCNGEGEFILPNLGHTEASFEMFKPKQAGHRL